MKVFNFLKCSLLTIALFALMFCLASAESNSNSAKSLEQNTSNKFSFTFNKMKISKKHFLSMENKPETSIPLKTESKIENTNNKRTAATNENETNQSGIKFSSYGDRILKKSGHILLSALISFILGFILLFVSINLICKNEKVSAGEYSYIEWMQNEVEYIHNYVKSDDLKCYSPIIIEGGLKFLSKPNIPNLELDAVNKNIFFVDISMDKCEIRLFESESQESLKPEALWSIHPIPLEKTKTFGGKLLMGENIVIDYSSKDLKNLSLEGFEKGNELKGIEENVRDFLCSEYEINKPFISCHKDKDYETSFYYLTTKEMGSFLDEKNLSDGDVRVKINYYTIDEKVNSIISGNLIENKEENVYEIEKSYSNIYEVQIGCLFCCFNYSNAKKTFLDVIPNKNKESYIAHLYQKQDTNICLFRTGLFLLHTLAYGLLMYPVISLLSMLPGVGLLAAILVTIGGLTAAVVSYGIIFVFSWICIRPFICAIIIASIVAINLIGNIISGKISRSEITFESLQNQLDGKKTKFLF